MATLGRLMVPIGGDSTGLARELARSAKLAQAWSKTVGATVDKAFGGIASKAAPLRALGAALSVVGKGTALGRTVISAGDAYRAVGRLGVGFDRLRLAFTFNGAKADELREKIGRTTSRLDDLRNMSFKARVALFKIDLAAFSAKLAVVASKLSVDVVLGVGRATAGLVRFGTGLVESVSGVVRFVPNVVAMTRSLYNAGAAASGSAKRTVELASAWFHARKAGAVLVDAAGGIRALASGAAGAARGLAQVGVGVAKIGWKVAVSGASALAGGFAAVGSAAASATLRLGGVVAVVGLAATALGVKAAAGAAHLEETYNKVRQTFGEYAGGVLSESKKLNIAFAVQEQGFLDGASAIGAMLKGMGYAQGDAAKLGTNLAKLAADSKAFRDVGLDVALQKIRSGLSGESEPLKEFGIIIDEDTVKAYAYAKGIAKVGKELTNSQKVQARMALITKGLADDQGALAREATGTAAQIAEFWGRVQTLMDTIGATVAPTLGELLQGVNVGIQALSNAWRTNSGAILAWFGVSSSSLEGIGGGVGLVTEAVVKLAEAWSYATATMAKTASTWQSLLSKSATGWSYFYRALSYVPNAPGVQKYFEDAADEAEAISKRAADAAGRFATDAATKLAEIPKVGEAIRDSIRKTKLEIDSARAEAAAPLDFKSKTKPKDLFPTAPKGGKKATEYAAGAAFGSKEAGESILKNKFGARRDSAAEKTAANTKRTADVLDKVSEKLDAAISAKNIPAIPTFVA